MCEIADVKAIITFPAPLFLLMFKLFVSGFPLEITEMQLAQLIAPHGNIGTIKIVRDRQTRKCKGYAFVEMLTEEDAAQAAAALDGQEMEERELTVRLAEERQVAPPPRRPSFTPRPNPGYKTNNNDRDENRSKRPRKPIS